MYVGQARPQQVSAAPLADEGDPPAGHPARLEIVPRPVGQLPQILAVRPHLEEVITPLRVPMAFRRVGVLQVFSAALAFDIGKDHGFSIIGDAGERKDPPSVSSP